MTSGESRIVPPIPIDDERRELIDQLQDAIVRLYRYYEPQEKSVGVYLHQMLNLYGDKETLRLIIQETNRYIASGE